MARNRPCPCGSGRKAKWCCGVRRGPGPAEQAKAFLAEARRKAVPPLVGVARADFEELLDQVADLPGLDVSLQLRLPRVLGPELEAVRSAIGDDDGEAVDELLGPAVARVDDPRQRAELAGAVLASADAGRIDRRVAAVAVVDLSISSSTLLRSSRLQALAVSVRAARTPGGLLVVSRGSRWRHRITMSHRGAVAWRSCAPRSTSPTTCWQPPGPSPPPRDGAWARS